MNLRYQIAACIAAATATAALAQDFPSKPITFVVPFAAGSATDQIARAIGQSVASDSRQSVVVETSRVRRASWPRARSRKRPPTAIPC